MFAINLYRAIVFYTLLVQLTSLIHGFVRFSSHSQIKSYRKISFTPLSVSQNNETSTSSSSSNINPVQAPKLDFEENHYDILEVNPLSSQEELKKAYYKIVFKYHPDNKETEDEKELANRQMMVINFAYKILRDPSTRAEYDESIRLKRVKPSKYRSSTSSSSQSKPSPMPSPTPSKSEPSSRIVNEEVILKKKTTSPVSAKFRRMVEQSEKDINTWKQQIEKALVAEEEYEKNRSEKSTWKQLNLDDEEDIYELLYSTGDGSIDSLRVWFHENLS